MCVNISSFVLESPCFAFSESAYVNDGFSLSIDMVSFFFLFAIVKYLFVRFRTDMDLHIYVVAGSGENRFVRIYIHMYEVLLLQTVSHPQFLVP